MACMWVCHMETVALTLTKLFSATIAIYHRGRFARESDQKEIIISIRKVVGKLGYKQKIMAGDLEKQEDLKLETLESVSEPVVVKPKVVSQPKVWFDAPIIEEYETWKQGYLADIKTIMVALLLLEPMRSENQANKTAGPEEANHSAVDQEDKAFLEELEGLKDKKRRLIMQLKFLERSLLKAQRICFFKQELLELPKTIQFKIQKVWILVDLPYGNKAIGLNGSTGIRSMKEVLWLEIRQGWVARRKAEGKG
ncbi:hypothetical protein Tco_0004079 [Tanacetum coccineum]